LVWNLAHAAEVRGVRLGSGPTGTRAEVQVDREAEFSLISLQNPDRLVIDLPDSRAAGSLALPPAAGVVKGVRAGQPVAGTTRIVFDLASPVVALKPRFESGPDGTRLVIEWPGDGHPDAIAQLAAASARAGAPAPSAGAASAPTAAAGPAVAASVANPPDQAAASAAATSRLLDELRASGQIEAGRGAPPAATAATPQQAGPGPATATAPSATATAPSAATVQASAPPAPAPAAPAASAGTRPLVIAIDAGHGGQDPGAIGPTGTREKDVTLAIARELARQINATPGLRAHLVRDRD